MSRTHGHSNTRTYRIWEGMKSRCYTPSATGYIRYGGRGIKVCERWHDFENFLADMGEAPLGGSIDRVDSHGDYEPANCRWATTLEQNRNQVDLYYLEFRGRRQCLSAWAEEFGATYSSIKARLNRGWPIERALVTPIRAHKPYERRAV